MQPPRVELELPGGRRLLVGPDAVVGRSRAAQVRLDDPRVSSLHAEISWRSEGFVLLARGGRLAVDGRGVREVPLRPGVRVAFVPGVEVVVIGVEMGDAPLVPPTEGRDRLRFEVGDQAVRVFAGTATEPLVDIGGAPGRILAQLLHAGSPVPWDAIAVAIWPDEGVIRTGRAGWMEIDERRLRNRWDQKLTSLRKALAPLRDGEILSVRHGTVEVRLGPEDEVTAT